MASSRPARIGFLAAVLVGVLVTTGCGPDGDATGATRATGSTEASAADGSSQANLENTSNPRVTGAAKYLPSFADAGFAVNDVDLTRAADPAGTAAKLLRTAVGDGTAPRFEIAGVEASTQDAQIQKTIELTTAALNCLNRKGHLAAHAYTDPQNPYSLSVAFVMRSNRFQDGELARCAITSQIPYRNAPDPAQSPTIAPCVGQRRTGPALITWVGTTDRICAALGGPVAPVDRALTRGSSGTDVARLQLALNDVGAEITVDGRLGRATVLAVRAFQRCSGVVAERPGVADSATLSALRTAQSSGWSKELCPS